jgi:hypothetical protein
MLYCFYADSKKFSQNFNLSTGPADWVAGILIYYAISKDERIGGESF